MDACVGNSPPTSHQSALLCAERRRSWRRPCTPPIMPWVTGKHWQEARNALQWYTRWKSHLARHVELLNTTNCCKIWGKLTCFSNTEPRKFQHQPFTQAHRTLQAWNATTKCSSQRAPCESSTPQWTASPRVSGVTSIELVWLKYLSLSENLPANSRFSRQFQKGAEWRIGVPMIKSRSKTHPFGTPGLHSGSNRDRYRKPTTEPERR